MRLITGLSSRRKKTFCSRLLTNVRTPIGLCKRFSCKHVRDPDAVKNHDFEHCRIRKSYPPVDSKTRKCNGRVGSGRTAGRRGGVGQNSSSRRQATLVPFKVSKTRRLNVSPEARTTHIVCKTMEEQNLRLTRGLSAVYQRDRERSSFLAADQCTDACLSL